MINSVDIISDLPLYSAKTQQQPRSLYLLFFTELWERFGFYTSQTIMILYMTKALLMPDHKANLLYATFSSLLYLTPIIGGYLADRYLGFQRAILIGGLLFIVAYTLTAFNSESLFFLGLSILICANGFFKPNVSSLVGDLYYENDPRRDGGFTLFYMGINIGALIPPLIAGILVAKYGWHSGFLLAAIGMLFGQIIFLRGRKHLGQAGRKPKHATAAQPGYLFYSLLITGTLIAIALCRLAFYYPEITTYVMECASIVILGVVLYFLFKEPLAQRKKMFACLILIIISTAFWSLYNQAYTSLMLFADRNMDKHFLGIPLDAEATQFFNPFFIISLSPILSRFWIKLGEKQLNPSIPMKFSVGVLLMSMGYLLLALGANYFSHTGLTSPWWLCSSYLLQTIAELLISPIGLAMITVLCPKHLTGLMMGVWFFSQAISYSIGGMLANIASIPENLSAAQSLPFYSHAFAVYGSISLVATVISFTLIPFLNKMTRSRSDII
jgi:POT family proton-dependent oligopeptide transporter